MENIQNIFFDKNNLIKLNDIILQKMNLNNTSQEQKKYIVETLIKHMKIVWQKIDISKINKNNLNTIMNQFNSYSLNNTIKELQEKIKPQNQEPSQLKFERDFLSTPQNPVLVPQRAQPTQQYTPPIQSNKQYNQPTQQSAQQNYQGSNSYYMEESKRKHQLASQFEPEIDSLFRPLTPDTHSEPSFNNYNFNKDKQEIKKRLDDVKSFRDNGSILIFIFLFTYFSRYYPYNIP